VTANGIRLPFALSLVGHAVLLALLALFVTRPPPPLLQPTSGIVVTVAPSPLQAGPAPAPAPPMPPSPSPPWPAPPEPSPVAAVEPPPPLSPPLSPPPPTPTAEPPIVEPAPLPPFKRALRRSQPVLRHPEQAKPSPPAPESPTPQSAPPAQTAYARIPAPAPAVSEVSAGYRALLGAWLERHKRYPEQARERGEEGRAVLQFTVDRSGRVLDFAVIRSSGYPDLDTAVESMMRDALLPPFPADMPQSSLKVAVGIRFSLR
jgi:periplasmic protein TonB